MFNFWTQNLNFLFPIINHGSQLHEISAKTALTAKTGFIKSVLRLPFEAEGMASSVSNGNKTTKGLVMARVNVPTNPDDLIALAQAIVTKHKADGAGSPLAALNMTEMDTKTIAADTQNKSAAQLYRDAEKATQDRDLALGSGNPVKGSVLNYVRSVRDILSGINKGNEQALGDWGFEVDQSTAPASKKTTPPA